MTPTTATPRVLVPRSAHPHEPFATAVREAGYLPVVVPLISVEPPPDLAPLRQAVANLAAGGVDWLVLTSARALDALRAAGLDPRGLPEHVEVAVVGPRTAEKARAAGLRVSLVPRTELSARGLLAALTVLAGGQPPGPDDPDLSPQAWGDGAARGFLQAMGASEPDLPRTGARALVAHSDLAGPLLVDGLRSAGWEVTEIVAYRTVLATRLPDDAHDLSAVVLTSSSTARAWARLRDPIADPPVVCLGEPTAATALAEGLRVSAIAAAPTPDAVVAALRTVLPAPPESSPHP